MSAESKKGITMVDDALSPQMMIKALAVTIIVLLNLCFLSNIYLPEIIFYLLYS
jgi:hypothetical protein